jgi:type I restriction-modification system DNA methylase subunit
VKYRIEFSSNFNPDLPPLRVKFKTTEDIFQRELHAYSKRMPMEVIAGKKHNYNLNIPRYISTRRLRRKSDLEEAHGRLDSIEKDIGPATKKYNQFLEEWGLSLLPYWGPEVKIEEKRV